MWHRQGRMREGRALILVIAVLALILAGLIGYHLYNRDRYEADQGGLAALKHADLALRLRDKPRPGDWPEWRGPNRDGVSLEKGLLTEWPKEGPPVLWKVDSGVGFSSLAIAGGRVYTMVQDGDNEVVVCLDADTGKNIWRFPYPAKFEAKEGSGPRSTPTVDGDRVYTIGATGILHCLKTADGKKVWSKNLLQEFNAANLNWGVSFSPLIDGDLLFTQPGGGPDHAIVALDKRDGKLVSKTGDDVASPSSPIAATIGGVRQVLFFMGNGLVGMSASSEARILWRFPWDTQFSLNVATPVAVGDYVFISAGYGKGCALVHVTKQDDGSFQANRVYQSNRMLNHFSSSVYYQDHIYGFSDPGILTCLDFRTGDVKWKHRGFSKGTLLVADGRLIVLGEKGQLAVADANPKEYRETASFELTTDQCWTVPALSNGKLYVRNEKSIWCLDLRKK